MKLSEYSDSKSFFEISVENEVALFNSGQARFLCLKDFFKRLLILPMALVLKACKTLFRYLGVLIGFIFLLLTLGSSEGIREYFVERISALAHDLTDWVLLPLAIISSFLRLLLAFAVHPNLYFNC